LTRTVRSAETTDADDAASAAMIEERIPRSNSVKRMIDDVDLAPLVAFLASPLSFVLNGESIEAGGGVPGTIRY
jgi:NAD(P)-dependent dehydrogenase (short-subunit alcohol dehydrogenase family)